MPQAMTAKARVLACAMLICSLSSCARGDDPKTAQWRWPLQSLFPVEESPKLMYLDPDSKHIVVGSDILVLPLFHNGKTEGKDFKYALARPFIYKKGQPLIPPTNMVADDGEVLSLITLAPGYWPGEIPRVFFDILVIDGKKQIVVPMAKARSKEESQIILESFELVLTENNFVTTPELDLARTTTKNYIPNKMRIATADSIKSYHNEGVETGGWAVRDGETVNIIFSREDRELIHSFIRSANESLSVDQNSGDSEKPSSVYRVYKDWPFDSEEAKRRQMETASALKVPVERRIDLGDGLTLELMLIPAGEFMMGGEESPEAISKKCHGVKAEPYCFVSEQPQHRIRITNPFYIGKYEVTQDQWEKLMGTNPSDFKGKRNPIDNASWNDCQEFLKKLNKLCEGKVHFALPTEAEWEYACRAGTQTAFNTGKTIATTEANYNGANTFDGGQKGVTRETTLPVGSFAPNAFGLYDMHGNVEEWCNDWCNLSYYHDSPTDDPKGPPVPLPSFLERIVRGGKWSGRPWYLRSAARSYSEPNSRWGGFRVVLPCDDK